jgi:hypothetical protein
MVNEVVWLDNICEECNNSVRKFKLEKNLRKKRKRFQKYEIPPRSQKIQIYRQENTVHWWIDKVISMNLKKKKDFWDKISRLKIWVINWNRRIYFSSIKLSEKGDVTQIQGWRY